MKFKCFPHYSYQKALAKAGIITLYERRENTVVKLFLEVYKINAQNHQLYQMLLSFNLRSKRTFSVQKLNTDRVRKSYLRTQLRAFFNI